MPSPQGQISREVTAESGNTRREISYRCGRPVGGARIRPLGAPRRGGNGGRPPKWLKEQELQRQGLELTRSGWWDCDFASQVFQGKTHTEGGWRN